MRLTSLGRAAMIERMFAYRNDPAPGASEELSCEVSWQASLFGLDAPAADPCFPGIARHQLDPACWVDHLPRWLGGSDQVFAELVARIPWRQRRVQMYDRMLDEPRLTWWWDDDDGAAAVPLPVLHDVGDALSRRYGRCFDSIGLNFYRHGQDSVAWHGDRIRHTQRDPLVAIVSVGAPRPFLLRPRGGGSSLSFLLGQGDLLVMGGAMQHDWEHSVPKVAAAGPRISVTYRHDMATARARSSPSRNQVGENRCEDDAGVRVREHLAGTGSS